MPPTPPPTQAKPHGVVRIIFLLSTIISGLALTDQISNYLLPLTIRQFTENAAIIGLILALNPAFGFIAQPLIGVLSDRIWTPIGRRAFFLITGAPLVALCLFLVPESAALWQLVVLVVFYQFFQDVLWGSDHPLLADLLAPKHRTIAKGCMVTATQIVGFIFLRYGMGWAANTYGEAFLYRVGAGAQIVFVCFVAFFLKEKRVERMQRPKLTVKRYINDMLGEPSLRRFAILAFSHAIFINSITGYAVLYAVETVKIEKADFGASWSWLALISLVFAIPLGGIVERFPKSMVLATGYAIGTSACILGLLASDADAFLIVAVVFGFGSVIVEVTLKPFFTEFLPQDLIGQLSGAYNICFAVGRTIGVAGAGFAASLFNNNYSVIWIFALIFGVLSLLISLSIRDRRFTERKKVNTAEPQV